MPTCDTTHFIRSGCWVSDGPHEQAAVAAALDRQVRGRRVLLVDQVLEGRGEIVEHVLLVRQVAGRVPFLAVLAAAAEVHDRDHEPLVEQHAQRRPKVRFNIDPVPAVAGHQARIGAVELRRLRNEDVHRHFGPVLADGEFAPDGDVLEIDDRRRREGQRHRLVLLSPVEEMRLPDRRTTRP